MRKFILTTIIALFVVSVWLYAQEKDTAQGEPKVKVELIYQLDSTKFALGGKLISEIKDSLKKKGRNIPQEDIDWVLNSLRIELAKKEKILYTDDGQKIHLPKDMYGLYSSKNMKYLLIYCFNVTPEVNRLFNEENEARRRHAECSERYKNLIAADSFIKKKFEDSLHYWGRKLDSLSRCLKKINQWYTIQYIIMETATGKSLRTINSAILGRPGDLYDPVGFHISDNGKVVVVFTAPEDATVFHKGVIFYDESGNEKKKIKDFMFSAFCHDMSADGEMICAIKNRFVIAFNKDGSQLWQIRIKSGYPGTSPCIAISSKHKYVAVSLSDGYTTLLDNKGKIITEIKCTDYTPVFSPDEGYLFLASDKDTVYLIHTKDGAILWKKWVKNLSLGNSISFKAERLLIKIGTVPPKSLLLDREGTVLAEPPGYGAISPMGSLLKTIEGIYIIGGQNEE